MHASAFYFLILAVGLTFSGELFAVSPGTNDEAAIRTLEENFISAFRTKDLPKIMSCFAPGGKLFVFDLGTPREYRGHESFSKDWEHLLHATNGPLHVEMHDLEVTTNGSSLAFSHSIVHVSGKKLDGHPMEHNARITHVYEKINDQWLIVHEHTSVPIDMATGKPDFQSKP